VAPRLRAPKIDSRSARLVLPWRRAPYGLVSIAPRLRLGYRKTKTGTAGTWVLEAADGKGGEWQKRVGTADDIEDADGEFVLDFYQAADRARQMARGTTDNGRPATVDEALTAYAKNLTARGGSVTNAKRVHPHLPPALVAKPVSLLTSRELQHLRDGLVGKIKNSSINRIMRGLKAALNLAAKHDPRITNANAWRIGLEALPDAHTARNVILTDDQVHALIAAAYSEDDGLGLLVETAAITGARVSQLARLEIVDLQAGHEPRLMMPSSCKGKGVKKITRKPVPITASLAARLQQAAKDRERAEPLLLRSDGSPWRPETANYHRPVIRAVRSAGLDPATVTLYALRHSSIVRSLLAGVPVRVCAAQHDTSTVMLERTYSEHILDHSDAVARRGLLGAAPSGENIVPLRTGSGDG